MTATSTEWVGLCFLWFYVREHPKAQPAVVLVLNVSEDGPQLEGSSYRLGESGIELETPRYKAKDLPTRPRQWVLNIPC